MHDPTQVARALLAHARAAHAGRITYPDAARRIRALIPDAEAYADPIADQLTQCADGFEAGERCTVIVPGLMQYAAVDDGAVPNWHQGQGAVVIYTEADARARQATDAAELRDRYPGFPKPRSSTP